ncbi:MAG TPA: NAD+ synthase [Candidatus Omnitrophota bacterium]|nr:NAD+ synthase [Candidatus Omnitrophota bacterium]
MRIALAQINTTVGDLAGNQAKIAGYIQRAKDRQADIVVFPELAVTGYPPEDLLLKGHFVKENIKTLRQLAKAASGITVIVGFVDRDAKKNLYNAAAILENKSVKGAYYKQKLPNYGVFDEKRYFQPGGTDKTFKLGGVKYAVSVCEDLWEDVCQKQAKAGAKLLINISSSPYDSGKLKAREALIKGRAKQTKTHICYCNLVGGQDELVFDGSSMIVDPKGRLLAMAKEFEEDLLIADFDLGKNDPRKRALGEHMYKPAPPLERILKALVLGTKDYALKNGFKKAVVGLSGGIDSALVAALAVEALGKDNIIGITMPSRFSSTGTKADAKQLAHNLGIELKEIPIEGIFQAYLETLKEPFNGLKPNIAEENVQARIRGNILMALSNKFGWLVLTTGNKSEIAVGYCTLYGDMSGGFAVIKDVPKTVVYQLCLIINQKRGNVIPQSVIDRPPTAELRENQKDQDSLPPYDVLDGILKSYVEEHRSFTQMANRKDQEIVKSVISMVDRSEYKRRQAPPGIKITPRAFGKDWRLPITNKYKEF